MLKKIMESKPGKLYAALSDIIKKYEIMQTASGIAYYFTLAIFPFLMFLAALVGILQFPEDALKNLIEPLFAKKVTQTVLSYYAYLKSVTSISSLLFGFGFSLYSASRAVNALIYGINKVYHTQKIRPYAISLLYSVLFTVGIGGVLLMTMLVISAAGDLFSVLGLMNADALPMSGNAGLVYLLAAFAACVILTVLYCLAPVGGVRLRYALPGALLCLAGLHIISMGVSIYVRISTRFSVLYGSIGAVILLLLWLYFFGVCVLAGALLNRYIEMKNAWF